MIDRRFGENVPHPESVSNPLNKQFPKCRLYRQQQRAFITDIESKSCVCCVVGSKKKKLETTDISSGLHLKLKLIVTQTHLCE